MKSKNVLLHNRWERVLPKIKEETFDLVYTDPPYGKNYVSNIPGDPRWNKSGRSVAKFNEEIRNDGYAEVNWYDLANQLYRVLKNDTYLFLHCDINVIAFQTQHFISAGFAMKGCAVWFKNFSIGGDLRGAMKRDWEPILYFAKGKPRLNPVTVIRDGEQVSRNRISECVDWEFPYDDTTEQFVYLAESLKKREKVGFPTQKPLALCRRVIELACPVDGFVLDPFAGSGSIPMAAKLSGRTFYAIEMDTKAAKICRKRLSLEFSKNVRG